MSDTIDARLNQPTVGQGLSTLGSHHTGPTTTSAHLGAGPNYNQTNSSAYPSSSASANAQQTAQDARATTHAAANDVSNAAHDASRQAQQSAQNASQSVQQTAHDASRSAQQNASEVSRSAQQTASNVSRSAQQTASDVSRSAQQTASDASRSAQQTAKNAQEQANQKLNQAGNKLNQATNQANAKLHQIGEQAAQHPLIQSAQQTTQQQLNVLDQQLARFGFLNEFEARTRIPKTYGFLGFSITFALLILLNLFGLAQPITNLIGWAVPAYLTCHALESPQKGDDAQWLCYWIVFGFLNYIESAALRVVLYYIPHYFTLKLAATVWLMLPQTRGAEQVYYSVLRPMFQQGRAKAREIQANSPATTNSASGFTGSASNNRFGTTSSGLNNDSFGYSSGINTNPSAASAGSHNPFVATSAPGGVGSGFEGLQTTSAGSVGTVVGVVVPTAAGLPLPGQPMSGAGY